MAKPHPPRKPKRVTRRPRAATLDVFALLAEDVEPHAPEGWFKLPWRDGRQAVGLVTDLIQRAASGLYGTPLAIAGDVTRLHPDDPDLYWRCEELRDDVDRAGFSTSFASLLLMRLRMLQLLASNSHGGGHGYNTVLLRDWHRLAPEHVDCARQFVWVRRQLDALGVDGSLANVSPRRQQAFAVAWRDGLFRAAYALARDEP